MIDLCGFFSYNKCAPLVRDVDRGGGWIYVGTGGLWEMSVLSDQFYDEPRTSLEIKSIFF